MSVPAAIVCVFARVVKRDARQIDGPLPRRIQPKHRQRRKVPYRRPARLSRSATASADSVRTGSPDRARSPIAPKSPPSPAPIRHLDLAPDSSTQAAEIPRRIRHHEVAGRCPVSPSTAASPLEWSQSFPVTGRSCVAPVPRVIRTDVALEIVRRHPQRAVADRSSPSELVAARFRLQLPPPVEIRVIVVGIRRTHQLAASLPHPCNEVATATFVAIRSSLIGFNPR